jgi:hypothetical protein
MASAILIANKKGDILLYRRFRDDTTRQEVQHFCDTVIATKSADAPVLLLAGVSFMQYHINDVVLIAATKSDANCMMLLHFLN